MNRMQAEQFLNRNHHVVLATLKQDGRIHIAPVSAAYAHGKFRFTTPRRTQKARNIAHEPRVTLTVLGDSFWEWISVEGQAELSGLPEAREELRTVYEQIAGKPHPDWDEYDAAMAEQQRVVVTVSVDRMYPLDD